MAQQEGGQGQGGQHGQYQGKNIRNMRDAQKGDQGFADGQDQVVVTLEDGTEKVVKRSEVQERR
ncbi:MAG TPA: hypothetical protein VK512_11485 [Xanthobacteraceae bacterium]|jgi:hypothetical protein|nr:hypothetical protein [Xanthobacteraceae bacterium]